VSGVWQDPAITATHDTEVVEVSDGRIADLLGDAGEFFEAHLWESEVCGGTRSFLAEKGLRKKVMRAFGVGYAPVGPDGLMNHLEGLGYSPEEVVAAGLATRSVRGRAHVHLRSRVTFPVKDGKGRTVGFAGLGTHIGPSWALWVTSPEVGLYRRSEAVFGLDRAAKKIAASATVVVRPDCIEVLKAHQDGRVNAVTVHTGKVTREQMRALASGIPRGIDALELDLPPGMQAESKRESAAPKSAPANAQSNGASSAAVAPPRLLNLKRVGIVVATAIAAVNALTGAPLLAVWVGSQAQDGKVLSMRGVITVLLVLGVLEFLLLVTLTWLSRKYDRLSGRPATAGQTSPWHRAKRGDRVQDIRSRYGISAPEKVVAGCVVLGVLAFEVWLFFFAGSSLPGS